MLTRHAYCMIADAIEEEARMNRIAGDNTDFVMLSLADRLCKVFQNDNPRFDRDRFLKRCGLVEEETK